MSVLHIRLRGETVAALKRRARVVGVGPTDYVELVLWYAALELAIPEGDCGGGIARSMKEEELYFSVLLPDPLREGMMARSAARQSNLASYTGALVEAFLERFERDPGDLRLVARLGELLERKAVPVEHEVLAVLRWLPGSPVARMPEAYQARWLHQRFSPFLRQIEVAGAPADLTLERMRSLLAQLKKERDA
jgi:hypothetical protein